MSHSKKLNIMRWTIWVLAVAFYFYEYVLRVSPGVMVPELMRTFNVSAASLGTLSAFYLYAYAPMQLPVGMLMDKFGARKLLTFAAFLCGIGGMLFGMAVHLSIAELGRLLMGIGSSFAFIGVLYVSYHWFSGKIIALLIGIGNSIGMLGAFAGEGPLSYSVEFFGWRITSLSLGIYGLFLAVCMFILIRNDPDSLKKHIPKTKEKTDTLKNLKLICKNKQTWINGLVALFYYATTVGFAGLWGIPFLEETYKLDKHTASFATSMIFVGWIVGGPLMGLISDRIKLRKPLILVFSLVTAGLLSYVIYASQMETFFLFLLLFLVGIATSAQLLTYSFAMELNNKEAKGTAAALTNFFVFLFGSILQPLIGFILDYEWSGTLLDGIPFYDPQTYRIAMSIFPISLVLAFVFALFLHEKKRA